MVSTLVFDACEKKRYRGRLGPCSTHLISLGLLLAAGADRGGTGFAGARRGAFQHRPGNPRGSWAVGEGDGTAPLAVGSAPEGPWVD